MDFNDNCFDNFGNDPSDDFQEDMAEETGLFDDANNMTEEAVSDAPADDRFDLTDFMIIGTMVGGQMFDEAEERHRRKLIQEQEKKDK